ncbi:MAG TPA: ATP-binding protein [Bryobacteraceae bacterium]|nr:ATP-binding protein [Bryobacteraceae bacterium]
MTLQAKLTLGSVGLVSLMVAVVSAVDLANEMQRQFESTLERANALKIVSTRMVSQSLNRAPRTVSFREALRDPDLQSLLVDVLSAGGAILEVAVVDTHNEILLDSDPNRLGTVSPPYPNFQPLVTSSPWYAKLRLLLRRDIHEYYQLEQELGTPEGKPLLYVRVIIAPALIREDINPVMRKEAKVAVISVIAAFILALLFSAAAFRPLGRLGHLLDRVARGEYEPEKQPARKAAGDDVAVMASKVNMLEERLRGAQYEVSDLRGNIDRLLMDLEDAVFIFNRELSLVFASGSVEKFLGTERSGLMGRPISQVFQPNTPLGLLIAQATQTGRPVRNRRVPWGGTNGTGSAPPVVVLSVDLLESLPGMPMAGSGVLVRLSDPEAQRNLGRQLQTADRMAALSRISSGVAHEVKNPLNAILLHVEVARAKLARGDTEISQQIEIISREILRLDRVVKTFLDFQRPVELKLCSVAVRDLLAEVVELARPQAESAHIRVSVEQDDESVQVRVDHDLVQQTLLNVVVNAIEAMPEGGDLRFASSSSGDMVEIRISDTGPGIPPELREKIFRLYFTTKKEGSGIGLAMAFRIVQLHDGTIDFTSEPGKGTTFSIRLPLAAV